MEAPLSDCEMPRHHSNANTKSGNASRRVYHLSGDDDTLSISTVYLT